MPASASSRPGPLRGVVHWAGEPGLPANAEASLAENLQSHFAWEPSEPIHLHTSEGLKHLLPVWVGRGALAEVRRFVTVLAELSEIQGGGQPWRGWALEQLMERLGANDLLAKACTQLFLPDREQVYSTSLPYFQWLGEGAIRYLVVALGQEGAGTGGAGCWSCCAPRDPWRWAPCWRR